MNYKTTIFLLILLIVVGVYFFYVDTGDIEDLPLDDDGAKPALIQDDTFDATKVNKVTLTRGDETIVIEMQGEDWQQTEPVRFPVNKWSADQFANDAASLETLSKFKPGKGVEPTLSEAGLEPPTATLELTGDGVSKTIALGRTLSIGGRGYVRVDDSDEVYVVSDKLHKLVIDGKPGEWRKKSMTATKEGQADRVTLTTGGNTIELVKTDGKWALAAPHSGRVATKAVTDLLNAHGQLYIGSFVKDAPDSLALYGLDNPTRSLTIVKPAAEEDGEPTTLGIRIGAPVDLEKKNYYAVMTGPNRSDNVVFQIGGDDAKKFDKTVDDLRDKRITPLAAGDVSGITIAEAGEEPIAYTRSLEGWAFGEGGPDYGVDATLMSDLLSSVTSAEATSFATDKQDAQWTVTLEAAARPEPDVLKIWETQERDEVAVLRNREAVVYVVPREKLEDVFAATSPLAMRDRTVETLPKEQIGGVTLASADNTITFTRQRESDEVSAPWGPWSMKGAARFEADALKALLDAAAPVKAENWQHATGSADGDTVITLTKGEQSTRIILAGDVASVSDVAGVFTPSQALRDAVAAEFAHRTVLDFDVDSIEQVTADGLVITRDGDGAYQNPDGNAIDQSKAGKLFDTLAGLRVERYGATVGDAAHTIVVNDHTLVIDADGNAKLGDRTFSLSEADVKALTAKLVSEDESK